MADDPTPEPELDIGQLAWDIAAGQVLTSWQVPEDLLQMVFLPLAFVDQEGLDRMKAANVMHLYEYMGKAGPRSINGYPSFMSFKTLTRDQCAALLPKLEEIKAMKAKVTGKPA
jgi:hypothetical protein